MDIITHAKFYFSRLMLTFILASGPLSPPPPPPPRAWRTTEKAGPEGLKHFHMQKTCKVKVFVSFSFRFAEAFNEPFSSLVLKLIM